LITSDTISWQDRSHFLAVAATQLRRILIDHARARSASKRGHGAPHVTLADLPTARGSSPEELIALDEALHRLHVLDNRAARVLEMRFFGGLEEKEIAEVLSVSVATVKRDWQFARVWMLKQLRSS
jgi:RNA polymerase sigma factor (TIGR02999 family)